VYLDKEFYREHGFGSGGFYALLAVSDVGTGIDEDTQKKIFEPFFTSKEPGHGTGLGLSIVYGIVKQHGGYICVSSELGLGTTFSIYLPLIEAADEQVQESSLPFPQGGNETILFAEDDAAVRELVQSVLSEYGYRIMLAHDGQEAVEIFSEHAGTIDLALFDVIMPRKSGKQACDELRQLNPALKILLLSGYTAEFIASRGGLVEGVELIMKPVQPRELARKVREMLDLK
jgi:CheY-like chemotaxis protein